MATIESRDVQNVSTPGEVEKSAEFITGGSLIEALAGVGAVVLAIVGLAGIWPAPLLSIATIVVGVALLFQGGAVAARYSRVVEEVPTRTDYAEAEVGGGISMELLGGVAGIVLGILALIDIVPATLVAIAAIVLGMALLLSSGVTAQLSWLSIDHRGLHQMVRRVAREAVQAAAAVQVLTGIAAAVLGILALINVHSLTLSLVAVLCLGAAVLLTGGAVSGRMFTLLRR